MGFKGAGSCLRKVLGALLFFGILLIVTYTEFEHFPTYSSINSTITQYLRPSSSCEDDNVPSLSPSSTSELTTSKDEVNSSRSELIASEVEANASRSELIASEVEANASRSELTEVSEDEANASRSELTASDFEANHLGDSVSNLVISPSCNCTNTTSTPAQPCPPVVHEIVRQDSGGIKQWYAQKPWHSPNTFPLCTMDTCFNFSRCQNMNELLIYHYDFPFAPVKYFMELESSPWHTSDPNKACLFLVTADHHDPHKPHPNTLPHWNGGLNHLIATFTDKWSLTSPPPHTIGNASLLSSELHETTSRPGFDIAIPLPGKTHFHHLQGLKPFQRKYFVTFKGVRYLGETDGNFRSHPSFKAMHNGDDVIVAVSCRHITNDKIRAANPEFGEGCDDDEKISQQYNFGDLMNSTFCLAPAGRSPSSYRMNEVLSAGGIPVLICDNYVRPFDTLIHWHQCLLQFPTSEMHRIVPTLRALSKEEVERRQKYCLFIYNEYMKDDITLLKSVIKSLKLRFYGMFPDFNETLNATSVGPNKRRRLQ